MAVLTGFDASKVEPQTARKPIPVGDYKMAVSSSEMKPNKKNNGSFLKLELTVLDGEHKGRKVFTNLNLQNPSKVAVEIAKGELSAICRAVSVLTPNDSAELHNKPMWVSVGMEKRADTGDMQNNIKGYKSLAAKEAEAASAPAPAANGVNEKAPW